MRLRTHGRWLTVAFRVILIVTSTAFASLGADPPKFETASVKSAQTCSFQNSVSPGRISLNGDTLKVVLKEAFGLSNGDRIVGPSWLDAECYQIVATLPAGSRQDQVPQMLRALLVERFKLVFHPESRTTSGYVLLVDKKGSRLTATDETTLSNAAIAGTANRTTFGSSGTAIVKGSMSIGALARQLSNRLKVPVEDLTGLAGRYDIDLRWNSTSDVGPTGTGGSPPDTSAGLTESNAADLFDALRSRLGLRLESRKISAEFIVIDHIERIPTEN
jgi:uncharacterized protein (TIGR03435 family)